MALSDYQLLDSAKKAVFVISSLLLVFAAIRNSLNWHMWRVWGASRDFWQNQWTSVVTLFGRDSVWLGVGGTFMVSMVTFWIANVFLIMIDVMGKPSWLIKYRVQEDREAQVDKEKLKKALKQVIFNQIVIGIPFTYVMSRAMERRGCDFFGELPSFQWVLLEIMIFTLVEEVAFYYSHRLFHHPMLYKHIHKQHHEWTAPIGIISLYAHPLEHVVSNLIPPVLGPFLMGSHLATAWMWFCLALLSTTVSHSGYHFPFLPSPEAHDYHHLKFTNNFGVLGVLDRFHGTDTQFRASKVYQRHILLLGTTPVSVQFPKCTGKGKKLE